MSFIYAVQMQIPNYSFAPIKIGFSVNPEQRVKEFTKGPFPTVWLGQWEAPNGLADEFAAHREFHKFRLYGEWFYPSPDVVAFVERNLGRSIRLALDAAPQDRKSLRLGERLVEMLPLPAGPPANIPDPFEFPHHDRVREWMALIRPRWPNADKPNWNLDRQCAKDVDVAELLDLSVAEVRENVPCLYIQVRNNPYRYLLRHVKEYLEDHPSRTFKWA